MKKEVAQERIYALGCKAMAREPAGPPGEPIDVVLINGRVFKPPSKYLPLDHRFVPLLAMIRVSLQRVGVNAETLNCSKCQEQATVRGQP